MAIFTVGPNSTYPSIAAAMAAAGPGDTIQLEAGYSNETAVVTHSGMIITGQASSTGIMLQLGSGIATVTLAGAAPIDLIDAGDGNGILGNDGDNRITVTAGADSVGGGTGDDRLFVDYRLATGAVTGNSTSNVAEAGGGGRLVTINGGFEHFTIWTGAGADTITTGGGDDDIRTGEGAGTVTAGEGANHIVGGSGADTITAGGGGNFVDGGGGTNTITTGGGIDEIVTGSGADTIVAGAGSDRITVSGGADTVDAGADSDLLIVDYSATATDVTGGITGGSLLAGYSGHLADLAGATVDFVGTERFEITTGTGNDAIKTGGGDDLVTTGDGDDVIESGAGDDLVFGGLGDDFLDGDGGLDLLDGGAGDDRYSVDDAGDLVIERSGEGRDIVYASASYQLHYGVEVEILSAEDQSATTALGLVGNELGQQIFGNAGDNFLQGGGGTDYLIGRGGNDTYFVAGPGDNVVESAGEGTDIIYTPGDYTMIGGVEIELLASSNQAGTGAQMLIGNGIDQSIYGNAGVNFIEGGGGADLLSGLGGNDTYVVDSADDRVVEGAGGGIDVVYARASYALSAGEAVEILSTASQAGTAAIDLTGNNLANEIYGNAGANLLNGGGGADYLYGLGGADTFAFTSLPGGDNVDHIGDFVGMDDTIALDDSVFAGLALGGVDANAFVLGTAAGDADDRIIYDQATGQLLFDADGNGSGAAILFAVLDSHPIIAASDFTVI